MLRFFKKPDSEASDEELLQRYQRSGNLELLSDLYGRYLELVYALALKYLRDPAGAEDAVMAIFEGLISKARRHDIQNFGSWLHVVAKNHCLMELRRAGYQREENTAPEFMQSVDTRHHTLEWPAEQTELARLNHCLSQLPDQQKACIEAFYLQGYSYKEIAVDMGRPLGKVRSYIQNGRRNLRQCLEAIKQSKFE